MASTPRVTIWLSAVLIGAFQIVGTFGAARTQLDSRPLDGLAMVLLLAGPVALIRRDRWPLAAVAIAGVAVDIYFWMGYAYGPIVVSLVFAMFVAIQAGHSRATWAMAAAGYLILVGASLLVPTSGTEGDIGHLALIPGWLGAVLAVSEFVRIRREQAAERERAQQEELERERSEQRIHLAQELHDVLAHNISLINVQASVALHLLDDQPDQARPALASIKSASRASLSELRTALDVLSRGDDAPRAPAPGLADLDSLIEGVAAADLEVRFYHGEPVPSLPAAVELAAYRIVQEALTNVTRHARATTVTVTVSYNDGVTIEVADDGVGGAPIPGRGIDGMRRRAESVGGALEAGPTDGPNDGGGFRVAAHLPGGEV